LYICAGQPEQIREQMRRMKPDDPAAHISSTRPSMAAFTAQPRGGLEGGD